MGKWIFQNLFINVKSIGIIFADLTWLESCQTLKVSVKKKGFNMELINFCENKWIFEIVDSIGIIFTYLKSIWLGH